MKALRQEARRQLEQFLSALFLPDELIELRFIESWVSARQESEAAWSEPPSGCGETSSFRGSREITEFARRERANVYFGVCPRPKQG